MSYVQDLLETWSRLHSRVGHAYKSIRGRIVIWFVVLLLIPIILMFAAIYLPRDVLLRLHDSANSHPYMAGVIFLALSLALVTIGAALAWSLITKELQPLKRITETAAAIDSNTRSNVVPREGWPLELEQLARQIDDMVDRLRLAYDRLRHYADDVAHEFRIPINRMLLASEITLARSRSCEEYRDALSSTTEECVRLSRLVNSLLFLARAENAAMALQRRSVDVNIELHHVVHQFLLTAQKAGVCLSCVTDEPVGAEIDAELLERAVSNLVANAISHTPPGGSVTLSGETQFDRVVIKVADTGEGVRPEARAKIFDRFYRSEKVRSNDIKRIGLGLPITKSIVKLHGGSIYLESECGVGTIVTLYFPTTADLTAPGQTKLE